MSQETDDMVLAKAEVFFAKAEKVASAKIYDYAIELYLEGLRAAPETAEHGHAKLRELALLRQVKGGKKPTMMEKAKHLRGKTALEKMINAEFLFAKDPDHLPYAEAILKAAIDADYRKTAKWIADLIFAANNAADKPSFHTYISLKDSYVAIEQFDRALAACQRASRMKPSDADLAQEFQSLSAEMTVSKGKYDQGGDFRKSIKNRKQQEKLQAQEGVVRSDEYQTSVIEQARVAFAKDPNLAKNIFDLAHVLTESETDDTDAEAIELLENAYKAKSDFNFKQRAGLVRIKQIKRNIRKAKTALEADPNNDQARTLLAKLSAQFNETELQHYHDCVQNYPTDVQLKYEYGLRLMRNKKYDDAIPLLQQAQRDPRHKISSMSKIGMCFFMKQWYADAVDIFIQAMESHGSSDDSIAKELRYNLARSYEKQDQTDKAMDVYRKIAQLDFGYKDVRTRIDDLRKNNPESTS